EEEEEGEGMEEKEKEEDKKEKEKEPMREEENDNNENESLPFRPHCFRELNKKRSDPTSSSPVKEMIPRCKTIQPYLKWSRQIVPDDVVVKELPIQSTQLLSRVYCNCGAPLNKHEEQCPLHENGKMIHEYFYRNKMVSPPLRESCTEGEEGVSLTTLDSLSSLSINETVFNLKVQVISLSAQRMSPGFKGIPLCHIKVFDESHPPDSIGGGKLLRDLTTKSDKIVVGNSSQSSATSRSIDVRLAQVKKVKQGQTVILRDVFIVRAYSIIGDDGSVSPVWMLQAGKMDVCSDVPLFKIPENEVSTYMPADCSMEGINENNKGEEAEKKNGMDGEKTGTTKRKSSDTGEGDAAKRSKIIRLDERIDRSWMVELAERAKRGMESQEETTFYIRCTTGRFNPPTTIFSDLTLNTEIYSECMLSLTEGSTVPDKVWMSWMKTCVSFNTIKDRKEQGEKCCEGCEGRQSLFVYIPIKNPLDREKTIHLLIDSSHFREDNTHVAWSKWKKWAVKQRTNDMKRIMEKVNESSISVHRVTTMYLKTSIAFVINDDSDWITVSKR
ncbi:hypothetical protein PENTCL1PPCAC_26284, partial [Pristionchus entomophagus]